MTTYNQLIKSLSPLHPTYLQVDNESHHHAGYYEGKQSHFKLVIVSDDFAGKRAVARHQTIYALVNPLLTVNAGPIHALAIHAYTPDEWQSLGSVPNSPNCAGKNN